MRDLRGSTPRLIAEFVVIVVGVLVALGVDSWVTWRSDRVLEREYLERLIEDADYDLEELAFVREVAAAGSAYLDTLMEPGAVARLEPSILVGAVIIASNSREADLSRSTFQELESSGRIGLIQSRAVRTELAAYNRTVQELSGFWARADTRFQNWVRSRIPSEVVRRFRAACGDPSVSMQDPFQACAFDLGAWSPEPLRTDLQTAEGGRLLTYQAWRIWGTLDVAEFFRRAVIPLREIVEIEIRRREAR